MKANIIPHYIKRARRFQLRKPFSRITTHREFQYNLGYFPYVTKCKLNPLKNGMKNRFIITPNEPENQVI